MSALALYDAMVTAITECARVDEVKDIRDKAAALEAYYRQARNLEAEREAANVRLRAERRAGELLKELARSHGGDHASTKALSNDRTLVEPSPYASALADTGMSRQTAHRYQQLADMPRGDFEAALAGPEKPSTSGIIRAFREPPKPRVSDEALWLWGRLRDFENKGFLDCRVEAVLDEMTDAMRADVARLAPLVREFLETVEVTICEPA